MFIFNYFILFSSNVVILSWHDHSFLSYTVLNFVNANVSIVFKDNNLFRHPLLRSVFQWGRAKMMYNTVTIRCDTIQCNKIFVSDEWPTLETLFRLCYLHRQFTASYTGAIGKSGVRGRFGRSSARFPFGPGFEAVQYTNLTFLYFNSVYLNTASFITIQLVSFNAVFYS